MQTGERGSELETEGLEKMEVAVTGSEAEGFYGLLRGAVLHSSLPTSSPPPKKTHCAPSSTISHLPSQESKEPEVSVYAGQALESTYSTAPSVLEREIPTNMQPLCIQLGVSKECTDVRLGLQGGPINLLCYHLCSLAQGALGSGVGVPPLQQILLQP